MLHNNSTPGFTSVENKRILWDLLYNNGTFAGLSSEHVEIVRKTFEHVIVEKDKFDESVTSKNKRVLIDITNYISAMDKSSVDYSSIPITASELSAKKRAEFDNNLNKRRKEFDNMISRDVPKQIDFSDKKDEPLSDNMEDLINDIVSKREQQLRMVTRNQNDSKFVDNQTASSQPPNTALKIGGVVAEANIVDVSTIKDKHVSFLEDGAINKNNVVQNRLIELHEIHEMLSRVESNQDIMMELIKDIAAIITQK